MAEMFETVTELEEEKARPGELLLQFLRYLVLLLVVSVLLGEWYRKIHPEGKPPITLGAFFGVGVLVVILLLVLAFVEALEIAYTILRGKHADEFPEEAKSLINEMREHEELVYGAREWVVTMVVVAITLATEYREPYIPFLIFGWHVSPAFEPLWNAFAVLLTTIPIIWLAQGPGKILARANPLRTLMLLPTRGCWKIVRSVGWIVDKTGLSLPEKFAEHRIEKVARSLPKQNLRPSDEGFFLAGLQRYGFAAHELQVKVTIKEGGACVVEQKLVWYLLRFTGTHFTRRLYFGSKVVRNGPPYARGFHCPLVDDTYEPVARLLDGIWHDPVSKGLEEVEPPEWDYEPPDPLEPNADQALKEVRFWIHTLYEFPRGKQAFALRVSYKGLWDVNAFKVGRYESDSYEMTFEYPCRTYILEIIPDDGIDIRLANPQASVTFNHNPHGDEQRRLKEALNQDDDHANEVRKKGGIYCKLLYPIAGAQYKYSWKLATRKDTHGEEDISLQAKTDPPATAVNTQSNSEETNFNEQ